MRKQILVDMDGVLADVYSQFLKMEFEEFGIRQTMKDLEGKLEQAAFRNADTYVRTTGFFRDAPVMQGSVDGLNYLNKKYNVLIVSSATEYPGSLKEKIEWLNEHYSFISWEQMIFCGKKDSVKGDIMIDDHLKNLDYFDGKTILFTQPHNVLAEAPKHYRVNSWEEIIDIL